MPFRGSPYFDGKDYLFLAFQPAPTVNYIHFFLNLLLSV